MNKVAEAIDLLQSFKKDAIKIFGPEIELSEGLYFGTWFLNEPGSFIARTILKEKSLWCVLKHLFFKIAQFIFLECRYKSSPKLILWNTRSPRFERTLVTWVSWEDYQQGTFLKSDRYFTNAEWITSQNLMRIVIPYGENRPQSHDIQKYPNTILFDNIKRKKNFLFPSFGPLFSGFFQFFKGFLFYSGTFKNKLLMAYVGSLQASFRSRSVRVLQYSLSKILIDNNLSNLECLIPYEGQPEQLAIIKSWQDSKAGSITLYIHATLMNFPGTYLHPVLFSADKILAHGSSYEKIVRIFGWKHQPVEIVTSQRFKKERVNFAFGTVYLSITASKTAVRIAKLLNYAQSLQYNITTIKPHPLDSLSTKDCSSWIKVTEGNQKPCIVFEGSTTALFEALEAGLGKDCEIIHLSSTESFLDRLDNGLWDDWLDIQKLHPKGLFAIKLKKTGAFLIFS